LPKRARFPVPPDAAFLRCASLRGCVLSLRLAVCEFLQALVRCVFLLASLAGAIRLLTGAFPGFRFWASRFWLFWLLVLVFRLAFWFCLLGVLVVVLTACALAQRAFFLRYPLLGFVRWLLCLMALAKVGAPWLVPLLARSKALAWLAGWLGAGFARGGSVCV
jgi:hypothetical protein